MDKQESVILQKWNAYFYEDSLYDDEPVLKNKFGIQNAKELESVENAQTSLRADEMLDSPIQGKGDFEHLKAIHHHLFQDVYDWAGKPRTVPMTKGIVLDGEKTTFSYIPPEKIEEAQFWAFDQIQRAKEQLGKDPSDEQFAKFAATTFGELNYLHAFREGNGRSIKAFISQQGKEYGKEIEWDKMDKKAHNEARYLASHKTKPEALEKMIKENTKTIPQKIEKKQGRGRRI